MSKLSKKKGDVYHKKKIPKKVKEEVWISNFGKIYTSKCYIIWCSNNINVFNFHVGHDIPESKGGTDDIMNLKPICDRCNLSMGSNHTIKEWNVKFVNKNNNIFANFYKVIYILFIIMKYIVRITIFSYIIYINYDIINNNIINNNNIYNISSLKAILHSGINTTLSFS